MKVSYIIAEKKKRGIGIYSISLTSTIKEVAVKMNEHSVGALLVTDPNDENKHIGIISERDIVRLCCEDKTLDQIKISEIKLNDLIVITDEDTLETARGIMTRHHIRHLPVIIDHQIKGMITIRDVSTIFDEQKNIQMHDIGDLVGGTYSNKVY